MCRWLSARSRLDGLVEPAIASIVTVFAVGGLFVVICVALATNDDRLALTFNIGPLIVDLAVGFAGSRL